MTGYEEAREEAVTASPVGVGWAEALNEQFGSAPWWLVSVVLHLVMLSIMGLVVISVPRTEFLDKLVIRDFTDVQPEPEPPVTPHRFVSEQAVFHDEPVTRPDTFLPLEEVEVEDELATDNNFDDDSARGDEGISDMPLDGYGAVGFIGLAGPGGSAVGDPYARSKRRAGPTGIGRPWGPTRVSEECVDRALRWLARHQEPDGRWDGEKYEGKDSDVGITGLAALAFLGAGHSERAGDYRDNVRRAVAWLMSKQAGDGCIGRGCQGGLGYHHAIAGIALAESFGMGRRVRTGVAAQKAVDYSISKHQLPYSGWRYGPRQEPDMSVTGWFIIQIKSALVAELRVEGRGFQGAIAFLDSCTKEGSDYPGRVAYRPEHAATPTMTAVGAVSRLFMGWRSNDPLVVGAARYMLENLPRWEGDRGGVNFYYWYYATLAMFQVGGDGWTSWNVAMRETLVARQRKGPPDVDGSWDPVGSWCGLGGRVYSTAMGALVLEVYYRYLPMYR